MHFCKVCENMYYVRIDSDNSNKLIHYCRNCGDTSDINVSNTSIKKEQEHSFHNIINKYTKHDPTLPRVNNVLCPNKDCLTNTEGKEREIIYIRYDDLNIKYIYLCTECDKEWKTTN